MKSSDIIFIANLVSTLFLVGLIWTIQVVHYPLFGAVGEAGFVDYQVKHQAFITPVVGPPMIIEIVTAILLVSFCPTVIPKRTAILGVVLVVVIWLSTAFIQVPCHNELTTGFNASVHDRLVASNWIRTIAWSLRGGLVIWMLVRIVNRTNPDPPESLDC